MSNRLLVSLTAAAALAAVPSFAAKGSCNYLPNEGQLRSVLSKAPNLGGDAGGLFHGKREWAVVVNRAGEICTQVTSTSDPSQVWPGSLPIAQSKALTANNFSLDSLPMSTTRLYTLTQPGHSLYGTAFASPYNPAMLAPASSAVGHPPGSMTGGAIAYGGGVPLYLNGKIIGALGVSGDTSCADHEIAKRVRSELGLNPPGGPAADDIMFAEADGPNIYQQPLCINTWRNGHFIGNESVGGMPAAPPAGGTVTTSRQKRANQALHTKH